MKRSLLLALIVFLVLGAAGCATFTRKSSAPAQFRPRAFALAVSVNGGLQPTPQQWATIQAKVAESLAVHGWVLVTDLALADSILRIDFTPGPNDPENSGVVRVIAIRDNPRVSIASTTSVGRYPTSFGYLGSFQNATYGYSGFSNNYYYGWANSYYDGYSYGSANLNPSNPPLAPPAKPINPPHRQHPDRRTDCPPIVDHYIRPRPHHPSDGSIPSWPGRESPTRGEGRRWVGNSDHSPPSPSYSRSGINSTPRETTTWLSQPAASVPARTYSRADPSPSLLNRGSSRSGSSDTPRSERTYTRSESTGTRPERTYSSSDSTDSTGSRPERTYTRTDSARSWQDRSEASAARSESSSSRPERTYTRSDSSEPRSERSYSRSESSYSRSDSSSRSSPTRDYSPPSPPPAPPTESAASSSSSSSSSDPAR